MLFDSFNNVAFSVKFKQFFRHHYVRVVEWDAEVGEVTVVFRDLGGVSERTLVIGNGPGRGGHHTEGVRTFGH